MNSRTTPCHSIKHHPCHINHATSQANQPVDIHCHKFDLRLRTSTTNSQHSQTPLPIKHIPEKAEHHSPLLHPAEGFWIHIGSVVDLCESLDVELCGAGVAPDDVGGAHGVVTRVLREGDADAQRAVPVARVLHLVTLRRLQGASVVEPLHLKIVSNRE